MIRLIEALNYRCLRYVRQPLGPFHVLVGPNASGKTTFLDVVSFLGRMVSDGLEAALDERTRDFRDLIFGRKDGFFELAIEAEIPEDRRRHAGLDTIRYWVRIGAEGPEKPVEIDREDIWLRSSNIPWGEAAEPRPKCILENALGSSFFIAENSTDSRSFGFTLGRQKSGLANLPEDETKFPAATWLKDLLKRGIHNFALVSHAMRLPSPPNWRNGRKPDGSNLPWDIWRLEQPENQERFGWWLEHLRAELPDLQRISTVERPEDRHRYLKLHYRGGLEAPSWIVSDGILRLLALTIPAYLPNFTGVCLIEEPENGIHPGAIDAVFKSLSSVYGAQVLLATHSPSMVASAELHQLLCFKKTENQGTEIVAGPDHPALQAWKGEVNLGMLFAGGVLG